MSAAPDTRAGSGAGRAARTGTADLPLHGGRVPPWLFERMARLGRVLAEAIVLEYGRTELLRRLSHPFWFQSLGALMGMDWHSSGITTAVVGALQRGLSPLERELGLKVCGGRGRHSRRTPAELTAFGEGGKDGHPYPVPLRVYDETLGVLRRAVDRARLGQDDRLVALRRLDAEARALEAAARGPSLGAFAAEERLASRAYGGRTVFDREGGEGARSGVTAGASVPSNAPREPFAPRSTSTSTSRSTPAAREMPGANRAPGTVPVQLSLGLDRRRERRLTPAAPTTPQSRAAVR